MQRQRHRPLVRGMNSTETGRRRHNRIRRLSIQSLEQRQLLAGDLWTQRGGDAGHDSFVPVDVDASFISELWFTPMAYEQTNFGRFTERAVAIDDSQVYRVALEGRADSGIARLFAMDLETGQENWQRSFQLYTFEGISEPVIDSGLVYINRGGHSSSSGTPDPTLYALNSVSGNTMRSTNYDAQWGSNDPPTVDAGQLFTESGYYGGLSGYNSTTLFETWNSSGPQLSHPETAVNDEYVFAYNSAIYSRDDGTVLPSVTTSSGLTFAVDPIVDDDGNVLYTGGTGTGQVALVDGSSFGLLWEAPIQATNKTVGSKAIGGGRVAVGTTEGVEFFDQATGQPRGAWDLPDGYGSAGQLILTNDTVFVIAGETTQFPGATITQRVFAVNIATGDTRWSYDETIAREKGGAEISLVQDRLIVSSWNGVRAFDTSGFVSVSDNATTAEETAVVIDVLANDVTGGDAWQLSGVTDPANGNVQITPDNQVQYTPPVDFNGEDEFTYTITLGDVSSTARVVVSVTPINDPPVMPDFTLQVDENAVAGTIVGTVSGSDVDDQSFSYSIAGTAFTIDDAGVVIVADARQLDFETTPQFDLTVTVADAAGASATGALTVQLNDLTAGPYAFTPLPILLDESGENSSAVIHFGVGEPPAAGTIFELSIGDNTVAQLDTDSLTTEAGVNSYSFNIAAIDNDVAGADQTTTLTASLDGNVIASADVTILDDDNLEFTLVVDRSSALENAGPQALIATVSRNIARPEPMFVKLSGTDNRGLVLPESVTIPGGQSSVSFPVGLTDNDLVDGSRNAAVIANALQTSGPITLDPSFGSGGYVSTPIQNNSQFAEREVLVLSDGRILAAGGNESDSEEAWQVFITLPDGTPDPNFGVNGRAAAQLGPGTSPFRRLGDIAELPDGKLVLTGQTVAGGTDNFGDFTVYRMNADGSPDSSFGSNGVFRMETSAGSGVAAAVVSAPDGSFTVIGTVASEVVLIRFLANGAVDTSFGTNGQQTYWPADVGGFGVAAETVRLDDGSILLATSALGVSNDFGVTKFTAEGLLDTNFGNGGRGSIEFPSLYQAVERDLAVQADGKIVVVGNSLSTQLSGTKDMLAARLNADGSVDTDFGTNGRVQFGYAGTYTDTAYDVVVTSDQQILLAGEFWNPPSGNTGSALGILALRPDGSINTDIADNGIFFGPAFDSIFERIHAANLDDQGRLLAMVGRTSDIQIARYNLTETSFSDTTFFAITDDESQVARISVPASIDEGEMGLGTITLEFPAQIDRSFTLTTSDPTQATIAGDSTVVIKVGETSATFIISGVYDLLVDGDQVVTITAESAGLADVTATLLVTDVEPAPTWIELAFEDFEGGFGSYTSAGRDALLYTGGTWAHQGNNAANLQDDSSTSNIELTNSLDLATPGYTELRIEFWFQTVSFEPGEDFWLQYSDGTTWQTIATWKQGSDFQNDQFNFASVEVSEQDVAFSDHAKIRFVADANRNSDDVYLDEIRIEGFGTPPPNGPPVVADDSVTTTQDIAVIVSVLANDSDPENDPLVIVSFTQGSHGSVTDNGDGTLTYAPNEGFIGADSFSYTVSDGDGGFSTANVNVRTAPIWTDLAFEDFENGFGTYTDGGRDAWLYTGGSLAHQGNNAVNLQDNAGGESSIELTNSLDLDSPGYTELKIEFWFQAVSFESVEDFWLQYHDGTSWQTISVWTHGVDFQNGQFYFASVAISEQDYAFSANAKIRLISDAGGNRDDVYIDEIKISAR